jgi:transposase
VSCQEWGEVSDRKRSRCRADSLLSPPGSGVLALEFLPAYAPELNPVEYIWGYLKHHAMPNYCARDLGDLAHRARRNLRSMQRRSTLVCAFWRQAELF